MAATPRRAFIIGLDGAAPELVERFAAEGRMPHLSRLIRQGCYAKPFPVLPTHTPVNWATISTGAWPGTHGITGFSLREKGRPLTAARDALNTREVTAEFLWNAAARAGRKSALIKWAGPTYPVTVKNGIQVDGCFCICCAHEVARPRRYGTSDGPAKAAITTAPATGWTHLPSSSLPPLETEIGVGDLDSPVTFHVLCLASGSGYDTVIISPSKDADEAVGRMTRRDWTPWVTWPFPGPKGVRPGTFRLKLLELSPDGSRLELFCSQMMPLSGWTEPESIGPELVEHVGPFLQRPGYNQRGCIYGAWGDYETLLEEMEYQHDWYAEALNYLCDHHDCELIFLQTHAPDYIQDSLLRDAEPLTAESPEESAQNLELVAQTYASCDRMVGRILDEVAQEDDLIVIVSDHGCIGSHSDRSASAVVNDILIENGWLVHHPDKDRGEDPSSKPHRGGGGIDWSKTKAIFHDSIYIYLNVKGREPDGVVEPEEYQSLRGEIMDALHQHKDPKLGHCPFNLILRSEEAAMLGLYGNRVGDIIVTVEEGGLYGEGHGSLAPTSRYGVSSLRAILILAGPGVRRNVTLERPIWLTDVAPTIAHLMHIPPGPTMQGAILNDALTD